MTEFEFRIPVRDASPFCHKPIYYPPKARQWLKEYMASLQRLGVVHKVDTLREDPPTFTCSVVLVEQGQSGQDYRACANVPDVNHRTDPPVHPLPTCQDVIDAIGSSSIFSALDIKAGFHNIPFAEECKRYCGIITQDGIWVYDRIVFGYLGTPATF